MGSVVAITISAFGMALLLRLSTAQQINLPNITNQSYADILFALDYSGSTSNERIEQLKDALRGTAENLAISRDGIRIGIIIYHCWVFTHLHLFNGTSKDKVEDSIGKLPKYKNGWNMIGGAMDLAIQMFKDEGRNDSVKIFVLISDGHADCLPTVHAPCFGKTDGWNVKQCQTKGGQCARPTKYNCTLPKDKSDCPHLRYANSAVYTQAEDMKEQLGVRLVTVQLGSGSGQYWVNMECWASPKLHFNVKDRQELIERLGELVIKAIKMSPPDDCKYTTKEGLCKHNASAMDTEYECAKELQVVVLSAPRRGGKRCPKSIIRKCNLEDCFRNDTKDATPVYYAIKLVVVRRKPPKKSSWRVVVLASLVVIFVGIVIAIVFLALLLRGPKRRRGKSTGVQMTQREPPPSRRKRRGGQLGKHPQAESTN